MWLSFPICRLMLWLVLIHKFDKPIAEQVGGKSVAIAQTDPKP